MSSVLDDKWMCETFVLKYGGGFVMLWAGFSFKYPENCVWVDDVRNTKNQKILNKNPVDYQENNSKQAIKSRQNGC